MRRRRRPDRGRRRRRNNCRNSPPESPSDSASGPPRLFSEGVTVRERHNDRHVDRPVLHSLPRARALLPRCPLPPRAYPLTRTSPASTPSPASPPGAGSSASAPGAAAVSEESQARAEAWRRNSVDAHLQRTTEMAAVKRLDATRPDRPDRSERPAPPRVPRRALARRPRGPRGGTPRRPRRARKKLAPPNPLHVEAQALSVWVRPPRPPWWLPSRRPVPMDVESADAHPHAPHPPRRLVRRSPGRGARGDGPERSGKPPRPPSPATRGGGDYATRRRPHRRRPARPPARPPRATTERTTTPRRSALPVL